MDFLEKDLEDLIWDSYHKNYEIINNRGLPMQGTAFRQLNLGSYGIADIVTILMETHRHKGMYPHRILDITVYELKKDQINIETLLQALGYCKGIERHIEDVYDSIFSEVRFEIILVGKTVEINSNFCYLPDFIGTLEKELIGKKQSKGKAPEFERLMKAVAKDIMTPNCATLPEVADIKDLLVLVKIHHYKTFPVTDYRGMLIGVVSLIDVISLINQ